MLLRKVSRYYFLQSCFHCCAVCLCCWATFVCYLTFRNDRLFCYVASLIRDYYESYSVHLELWYSERCEQNQLPFILTHMMIKWLSDGESETKDDQRRAHFEFVSSSIALLLFSFSLSFPLIPFHSSRHQVMKYVIWIFNLIFSEILDKKIGFKLS